jgi:hypothetical protein
MGETFNPNDPNSFCGYAIRIFQGRVYYFNDDGLLESCSKEDAPSKNLKGLYRKNGTGSWDIARDVYFKNRKNKDAFKTAAAQMHEGESVVKFFVDAYEECERRSTKPHKEKINRNKNQFIQYIHAPKVITRKKYKCISVYFETDNNPVGVESIMVAAKNTPFFIREAWKKLLTLKEFEGKEMSELPAPYDVKLHNGYVLIVFRI